MSWGGPHRDIEMHIHTHTHIYTYTHTHIYTHIHIHRYTHMEEEGGGGEMVRKREKGRDGELEEILTKGKVRYDEKWKNMFHHYVCTSQERREREGERERESHLHHSHQLLPLFMLSSSIQQLTSFPPFLLPFFSFLLFSFSFLLFFSPFPANGNIKKSSLSSFTSIRSLIERWMR